MPTPFLLSGKAGTGDEVVEVRSPWDGRLVATAAVPTDAQVEEAVRDLEAARSEAEALPAHRRAAALDHVSAALHARAEEFAELITAENGKPVKWARLEVARAASTFRWAAEEARRFAGDLQRLDTDAAGEGRLALTRRFSRGPILAITPFNFPLNLVAHKVAPAIAVGSPVLVKPAPSTPLSALKLGEVLAETDLPSRMVSVLPVPNGRMAELVADPRLPVISFTGSGPVGWQIKQEATRKQVVLELGGNAAAAVFADWPDLAGAAQRLALFSNCQAGQSCISVQRVLVQASVYDQFLALFLAAVQQLRTGDPCDPQVDVGPVIDDAAARRITEWVEAARAAGARVLTGGTHSGRSVAPTVLADVPPGARVRDEEVFGPVALIEPFDTAEDAFAAINDSRFGLQAGLFTTNLPTAFRAHRELVVGGVVIGDVPSFRADQMPYGGWKDSGVGREGVRSAMHDLTDERTLVLTGLAL